MGLKVIAEGREARGAGVFVNFPYFAQSGPFARWAAFQYDG
jgi:hypothetical protein